MGKDLGVKDEPAPEPEIKNDPAPADTKPTYEELLARLENIPATPEPIREAYIPEDLLTFYETDDSADRIADIKSRSILEVQRAHIRSEKPYAVSDEDADYWIAQKYPDFDPSIPENFGLPDQAFKQLNHETDGLRKVEIDAVKADRKSKIEAIKSQAQPAPEEPFDEKAYQAQLLAEVDKSVAEFDPATLPAYEGIETSALDMEEVKKRAWGRLKAVNGEAIPDIAGTARELHMEKALSSALSTIKDLRRKDPELARQAAHQSNSNAKPSQESPVGDGRRPEEREKPKEYGLGQFFPNPQAQQI